VNRVLILIAIPALLVAACRRDQVFVDMTDSTYVQTMVALRQLPVGQGIDVGTRNRQRDSILREFGVTAAQVESTAVRLANDPTRAAEIWRAIESPVRGAASQKKNGA
jgi:hypothetical protein